MSIFELDKFYGRKNTLELLKRRVLDLKEGYRQNIAFVGDRYTGKSLILQKFLADLEDGQIVPVYADLENSDLQHLFSRFAGSMLYAFARRKKLPLHDDLALLVQAAESYLPQTAREVNRIQSHLAHGRDTEAYFEIINLPQIFTQETDTFCVLFLDEFQHLEDFGIPNEFQELGKRIMTQRRCLYVVTSSLPWTANKILSEKLSLLFGNFEIIEIVPFDAGTSQEFIRLNIEGLKISEQLTNFLVDFTGGHPLYLRLLCREMVALSVRYKQSEVFLPLISQAIEDTLFNRWGLLNRHFELMMGRLTSGKGAAALSGLLVALANGKQKIPDLARDVNLKQSVVTQKVNRLIDAGVVTKNGNYFYLPDKLFKYWLRYVYQKRRRAMDLNDQRQRQEFADEVVSAMEHFQKTAQQEIPERIIELLSCFENESLQINGRRYKLPFFQEIIPTQDFGAAPGIEMIKARTSDGEWVIAFKMGEVSEGEINNLLNAARKITPKPQRCILISFSELDENARVKALQERMWIWNEGEVNCLLNLFDKPFIIGNIPSVEHQRKQPVTGGGQL